MATTERSAPSWAGRSVAPGGIVARMEFPRESIGLGRPAASVWASVVAVGSRRWYFGGVVSLIWLVNTGFDLYGQYPGLADRIIVTGLLGLYSAAFLAIPPTAWAMPHRFRLLLPTALWALSFAFFPWLGWDVTTLWAYVGVSAALCLLPFRLTLAYIAVLTAVTAFGIVQAGATGDAIFYFPALVASISLMMAAFGRVIGSMNQLRATQHEMARLAVEQERSRVARDMHDILGHSLTVITVKAELAGRLVESDPERAAKEITEVEELARGALADVRSTVAGYRGVSVASELVNARTALEAAGIEATLPGSVDVVPAVYRELFGWVLREGVTNVVRHSGATRCVVELGDRFVQVSDNGTGATDATAGSGLVGLRERAAAAGATMSTGSAAGGGFVLRVSA
ncbi:MAG: sensor histidine kinase [Rhodoglobus sp.]